jgi:hypothetical protein
VPPPHDWPGFRVTLLRPRSQLWELEISHVVLFSSCNLFPEVNDMLHTNGKSVNRSQMEVKQL